MSRPLFSSRLARAAIAAWLLAPLAACGLLKDQRGEIERIEEARVIRAGVAGDLSDLERERGWLGEIAAQSGAGVELVEGETHELVDRLRKGEIDVLIALPADTPFKPDIGSSRPYENQRLSPQKRIWAVRPGANAWLYRIDATLIRHGENG